MTPFEPRLEEIRWALDDVAELSEVLSLPRFAGMTGDLVGSVLEQAGKFAASVFAPVDQLGDVEHPRLENGVVCMPEQTRQAYLAFVAAGWNGVAQGEQWGGQAFPYCVSVAISEMFNAANMALSTCPMLSASAVEAIARHGCDWLKQIYLPKLVSGEWTGAMDLTEPQAGSDVGALRTRAEPQGDHWLIRGQKVFISFGEHDLTDNIIHLVLARLPQAPPGAKGISLFLVPKFLVNPDGSPGGRNDVRCIGLEHKMGLHGSPTTVLAFGEQGGAVGYLIGREHEGMSCMFTMMNAARLAVGVQGLGLAERAYQQAVSYAGQRVQGRPILADVARGAEATIIDHPDVRRMLLSMRARTDAARALTYYAAARIDIARHHPEAQMRAAAQRRADLLVPLVKAWNTDLAVEITSLAIQVLGGIGFIEETGAAQHFRDARITPIYEGTNAIQANDLVGRKVHGDGGAAAAVLFAEIAMFEASSIAAAVLAPADIATLSQSRHALEAATEWLLHNFEAEKPRVLAGAVPYLAMFATVTAGWLLFQGVARAASQRDAAEPVARSIAAKRATAAFYARHVLAPVTALGNIVTTGGDAILNFPPDAF